MTWVLAAYYWPGDMLSRYTTVRGRRALGTWVSIVCSVLWIVMPSAIWLIGFMSVAALWSVPAAETPVEVEGEEGGTTINN